MLLDEFFSFFQKVLYRYFTNHFILFVCFFNKLLSFFLIRRTWYTPLIIHNACFLFFLSLFYIFVKMLSKPKLVLISQRNGMKKVPKILH